MPPITTFASLLAQDDVDGHMGWAVGAWIIIALGMILFLTLVAFGIVWVVRELGSPRERQNGRSERGDPLAILDRRLADGTITTEEYRERRATLTRPD